MANPNMLESENIILNFKERAKKVGVPLNRVFIEERHDRSVIARWLREEPKAIRLARDIDAALRKYERAKK